MPLVNVCSRCKRELPVGDFNAGPRPDGISYWCKRCKNTYNHSPKGRESNRNTYRRRKLTLLAAHGTEKCEVCGEPRPWCLDFHHKDASRKKFNIGDQVLTARVRAELSKCRVLCKNCHADAHHIS